MKRSMRRTIAGHRSDLGLSLQDLATRAGITKAHLWDLEQGRSVNPTIQTLAGLAAALAIPFGILAEGALNDYLAVKGEERT